MQEESLNQRVEQARTLLEILKQNDALCRPYWERVAAARRNLQRLQRLLKKQKDNL